MEFIFGLCVSEFSKKFSKKIHKINRKIISNGLQSYRPSGIFALSYLNYAIRINCD